MAEQSKRCGIASELIEDLLICHSKTLSTETPTNPRGIPFAPFVDKVEDYVSSRAEVEGTMRSFQEMISSVDYNRSVWATLIPA